TRLAVRQASEHTSTKTALSKFKDRMLRVDTLYDFFKEERNYFKNKKFVKFLSFYVYKCPKCQICQNEVKIF
ncbi:MAG: hypothetical protein RR614_14435, partial [Eubacterium sp.]